MQGAGGGSRGRPVPSMRTSACNVNVLSFQKLKQYSNAKDMIEMDGDRFAELIYIHEEARRIDGLFFSDQSATEEEGDKRRLQFDFVTSHNIVMPISGLHPATRDTLIIQLKKKFDALIKVCWYYC